MQDVPAALTRKGLTFACYFDPSRPAVLDGAHAARVNYETYVFADTAGKARFLDDVVRYCGLVTDPVTKRRFRPGPDAPSFEDTELRVLYLFENEASLSMFLRDPESYRLPGYVM